MTREEREAVVIGALDDYQRRCRRVFHIADGHIAVHGRESLPPELVLAVDAADNAHTVWVAAMTSGRHA